MLPHYNETEKAGLFFWAGLRSVCDDCVRWLSSREVMSGRREFGRATQHLLRERYASLSPQVVKMLRLILWLRWTERDEQKGALRRWPRQSSLIEGWYHDAQMATASHRMSREVQSYIRPDRMGHIHYDRSGAIESQAGDRLCV